MEVWAEPFTVMRLQKIFNLFQDPFERADITSNTFWDWQLNHVGSMYGVMAEVFDFAETFKEFPPRAFPPSFNAANVLEHLLKEIRAFRTIKQAKMAKEEPDLVGASR
jgi:arylsulfatase